MKGGVATPAAGEPLGAQLVHADGGAEHAAAGVGQAELLERALHRAVLAARSVQRDPDAVEAPAATSVDERAASAGSKPRGVHAARDAAPRARPCPSVERDLALRGGAAHQHGDAPELGGIR